MEKQITFDKLQQYHDDFKAHPLNDILQNTISKNKLIDLAVNREQVSQNKHIFSHKTEPRVTVTNQKSSGRCWMFACLNIIRREIIKKYKLEPDFELSQSYLFFWDKLERMNYNLECIIDSYKLPIDSRICATILNDPVSDGGQWDMLVNLIKKYGIVPKSVFGESYHSSNSKGMNTLFKSKFRETAIRIRQLLETGNEKEAYMYKEEFNKFVFDSLCKMIGTPPTKSFVWEFVDKDKKYHRLDIESPQHFFKHYAYFNLDDYICVISDPRKEHNYHKLYTVQYLGNVVGGQPVKYLNVPIEDMKQVTLASLNESDVVWFGCDVGQQRSDTVMSIDIKQYGNLLGTTFNMTKEERIRTGESAMTHAMVFSGYNSYMIDDKQIVDRWEVENSWGKHGDNSGYYYMTDEWFNEYMYEVVVHKKYAKPEMLQALETDDITVLPLWDPMGALALFY